MEDLTIALQALVAAAIFFVWVVRYDNIVEEFQRYGLPTWLRDLVGVLKLALALMLLIGIGRNLIAMVGGVGITVLMAAAFLTHMRAKTPKHKRLPCLALFVMAVAIAAINYQLWKG